MRLTLRGFPSDGALMDLLANSAVTGIPALQLALVEPDFDAGGVQRFGNATVSLRILGGVAQKGGLRLAGTSCPVAWANRQLISSGAVAIEGALG